jgi:uncharacterized iron-regulated membrane protein
VVLRKLHLWAGLALAVPLVLLGLTGSILVFEHELEDLFAAKPALASGEARPVEEVLAAARAAAPAELVPLLYLPPAAPGDPAAVRLGPAGRGGPGSGAVQVLIDPVSLDVLGVKEPGAGALRQIFMLHANLMTRDRSGRQIIGWLGVVMLTMGVTGIVLWWPRPGAWRAAFGVKRGASDLRLHRDLHGAVGIWGLAIFVVVSFSGVYLAFPQTVGAGVNALFPGRDLRAPPTLPRDAGADATPIAPGAAIAIAGEAVPGARLWMLGLPTRPDQAFRVALLPDGAERGAPVATVFVDPRNGRIIETRDPRSYTVGERILAWQHALHEGRGFGWSWRVLVFLSGFLPALFAVTGISMWLLKRRRRHAAAQRTTSLLKAAE